MPTDKPHADLIAASDRLASELVPPPADRADICPRCRTWNDSEEPNAKECTNCTEVRGLLGVPAIPVEVVTLYRRPSALREWLTGYKGRPERDEPFNPDYVTHVRVILGRFFLENWAALHQHAGGFDALTVVPSTDRQPPHPLDAILQSIDLPVPVQPMLERGPGELGFRHPSPDAYRATNTREPQRVMIVDDVYTTGARINSAAYALSAAGHTVAAALVIARRVNVDYSDRSKALWQEQTSRPFDWTEPAVLTNDRRQPT